MAIKVRVEAFNALGKIEVTSEDILLQTLSKRVLGITKEKKSHDPLIAGQFELMAPNVAGVVLHGLEDEYYEVIPIFLNLNLFFFVGLCLGIHS